MTTDVIGEVREIEEPRALVPVQPGQAIVSEGPAGPQDMLIRASAIATALGRMVEDRKLYTEIRGRKHLQVEAWMTIGRMDNVVAREAHPPVLQEDGAYEAEVELVRLSDGMVIGRASALCGAPDDEPWGGTPSKYGKPALPARPAHQRRSMAVTRATSRAFRQQYAWVVVLAGYEPTPADEMPHDDKPSRQAPSDYLPDEGAAERRTTHRDGLVAKAITSGTQDFELRLHEERGYTLPFRVKEGRLNQIVLAQGELALQLADHKEQVIDQRITVWGHYEPQTFPDKKRPGEDITYNVLFAERVKLPDGTDLPQVSPLREDTIPVADGQESFDLEESARIDAEEAAAAQS